MTLESFHVINTIRRLSLILCEYLLFFFKLFPSCSIDPIHVMISLNAQFCIQSSHIYLPQRSWGKVMFLQASVIVSTGGVCLSACWDALPPGTGRHPLPRSGRHPVGSGNPPQEQTPWSRHPLGAGTPLAQSMLGDMVNARAVRILLECKLVLHVLPTSNALR